MYSAKWMLSHLIKSIMSMEFGEDFAEEQRNLKLQGYQSSILEAME